MIYNILFSKIKVQKGIVGDQYEKNENDYTNFSDIIPIHYAA